MTVTGTRILRTPLCDLLGIEVPIISAGMRPIAGPDLVAVSNAGGLGVLGCTSMSPDEVQLKAQALLGDRGPGTTLRHYAHAMPLDDLDVPDAGDLILNRS